MISSFISSIAAFLAQKASLKQTQKEEIQKSLEEENIYRSESVFYVHAPKYMVPLIVFAGFAVFSFCFITVFQNFLSDVFIFEK